MKNDRDRPEEIPPELLDAAYRVGDAKIVDWSGTRTGDPLQDAALEQLQAISRIADAMREGGATPRVDTQSGAPAPWGTLKRIELIASGTFGEVWRAHDPGLERDVALKLEPEPGRWTQGWIDEARRLARVRHPHVISVYGADRHDGRAGIWMELIEGRTLEDLLLQWGPLGGVELAHLGVDLCAALGAVHGAGLVHGDVKTRNVMRAGRPGRAEGAGRVVLMDFGSAREGGSDGASTLTPLYAAPEQLRGGAPTVSSDIHALGVTLFRLATGRFPREGKSRSELLDPACRAAVGDLRHLRPDLPLALAQVVERAIEPDPRERFTRAAAMEGGLAACIGVRVQPDPRGRRRRGILGLGVGILLGAMGTWVASHLDQWGGPRFQLDPSGAGVDAVLIESTYGSQTNDAFGIVMASAGDVDGDGQEDFLISAIGADSASGKVVLLRGRADDIPMAWLELQRESPAESHGGALTSGDLNGDGFSDVVVGACTASGLASASGKLRVWWGGPTLDATPDLVWSGTSPNQYLGYALATADVDGDGYVDLCVGAPLDESAGVPTGRAFVYRGGPDFDTDPDFDLTSGSSHSQFGISLATGDFNGDGFGDLVVGANWENTDAPLAGRAYVYLGGEVFDTGPDLILRGPHESAMLGAVSGLGDIDGDGIDDFAVALSDPDRGGTSIVRIHLGGPRLDAHPDFELVGPSESDAFGTSFGPAGDFDADGFADFYIGAPSSDEATRNAGAVYLYRGGRTLDTAADHALLGKGTWDLFGAAAIPFRDPHGGARTGLMVGASWASDHASRAGRVDWFAFAPRSR